MIFGKNCNPEIQRIRYKKGQILSSRDLQDDGNISAMLRWLHNSALHESFGVNSGLMVTAIPEVNNVSALEVAPGLAYDCYGRELILSEPCTIQVPLVSANGERIFTLLIRYKETKEFTCHSEIKGVCLSETAGPLLEQPEFFWKPETLVELTDGVPLARVLYKNSENPVLRKKEELPIPASRPIARPRVGNGQTRPEQTIWNVWKENGADGNNYIIGMETKIDTSSAKFTDTPYYFASLQGKFWIKKDDKFSIFYLAPLSSIKEDASCKDFTFRLLLPEIYLFHDHFTNEEFDKVFSEFADAQGLYVSWFGIQAITEIH
jgi:hypothetical protein